MPSKSVITNTNYEKLLIKKEKLQRQEKFKLEVEIKFLGANNMILEKLAFYKI